MNVNKPNSFMTNNKINNKFQKNKVKKPKHSMSKKISNIKNKYQSDKKIKPNNPQYYILYKKISSDTMSAENQIILLQKRDLEIKDLKMKCQKLEQENHKYQLQNILLKNNNNNTKYISENNTSSNFPIKNEIKKLWENLAKIEILNNFIEFENEPEIIYHIICELISLSDKMIKKHCLLKYQEILKIMGVKNNTVMIKDIEIQFKNFMKEHLHEIFNYLKDKSFINDYKNQLKNIIKNSIKCINEDNMIIFEDILDQNEFNDILKNINDIILFTQFHEPTLFFPIEENYEKRKIKYIQIDNNNKKDYILVNNTNFSGNKKSIILLEPPCLKSGYVFYNELKPILMLIEENDESIDNNNEMINNGNVIIDDKIKFNSINNTSRINRNLNLDTINSCSNDKIIINKKYDIKKNECIDFNKNTIDNDSYYENKYDKNVITIDSCRPPEQKLKKFKKLSISKDINSEDPDFCSTDEHGYTDNNNQKLKQTILSNKKFNKIHRIKSANNYFDKKQKNKNIEKLKFIKQNTNIIKKIETYKLYNNYKQYIKNNNINKIENIKSKNNILINYSDGNQSLSNNNINKYINKPLTFKKYIKNKKLNNKIYNSTSNKKDNITNNKKGNNKINKKSSNNNAILKYNKPKGNINTDNTLYKNAILLMNKIRNREIIYPSSTKKDTFFSCKEKKNGIKNNKCNNYKIQNVISNCNNNSNCNMLKNNGSSSNKHFSNLSTNRTKQSAKRLDSFDLKNSLVYSTIEEIKKMIDDVNHPHKPIIMISTNSNVNNTLNTNKYHNYNFNKKNISKRKKSNYNTINNSIKQLISLSQPKIIENGNINNNIYNDNKINKLNTKSSETLNNCNYNNYLINKELYYKQFSIDETTFNTSSQFNITHDFNNKSNKNFNKFIKKSKENKTLSNDIKNKCKSNINTNNCKTNKNKIREKEINIDRLSNKNYNTINAKPNKNRHRKFLHLFDNIKID